MDKQPTDWRLSPLKLEELFRRSLSEISVAADDTSRIQVICCFINETKGINEDLLYSFYLQYSGAFFYLLSGLQPETASPEELLNIYENAVNFYKKFPDKIEAALAREGLANLLFHLALEYFYLGELEKAGQVLSLKNRLLKENLIPEAEEIFTSNCPLPVDQLLRIKNSGLSNWKMCAEFFNTAGIPEEILSEKDLILEKWENYQGHTRDSIYCTLVEKKEDLLTPEKARLISLTAHGRRLVTAEGQNVFRFFNLTSSLREDLNASVADGLEAADHFISQNLSLTLPPFFIVFSFPDKKFTYTGQSLGLPVVLLSLCQKLALFEAPVSLYITKEAAFTGRVDINGRVLRIEPEGLEMKIRTAFYSGLRYLVLPKENIKEASLILYRLLSKHPFRRLELIGVESIQEIIEDDRLIIKKSTPRIIWLIKTGKRALSKIFIFTLLLTALLCSVVLVNKYRHFQFWKSRQVVSIELLNDRVVALNENRDTLWSYQLKKPVEPASLIQNFCDIDDDGKKEALIAVNYKEEEKQASEILIFDRNGRLKWSYQPGKRIKTQTDEFSSNFVVKILGVWKFKENSPEKFILVVANHSTWYPTQITLLDISGRVIGEYWQAGHLGREAFLIEDTDEDGWNEIILAGTNNDFQCACLLVLDPRKVEGYSPSSGNPEFQFRDLPPGSQEYYILFPRTTLNQVMAIRNYARKIELIREDKEIEVICTEFAKENLYEMIYNFDFKFEPLFSRPTDSTIGIIKEMIVSGILPPQAITELRILKEKIRFWDGQSWSYKPAKNKYLKF